MFDCGIHEFSTADPVEWDKHCEHPWKEVFNTFKNIPTTDDYTLDWGSVQKEELKDYLINELDFSEERVESSLEKVNKQEKKKQQKGLGDFM